MSLLSYFTQSNFEKTIRSYCRDLGWQITEIDAEYAKLSFEMESGRTQPLFIFRFDSTLEFSVPSALSYEEGEEFPDWISTMLMRENAKSKVGFWCVETIKSKSIFSIMHNAEQNLMDRDYFQGIVSKLVVTCDEFEVSMEEAMSEKEAGETDAEDEP